MTTTTKQSVESFQFFGFDYLDLRIEAGCKVRIEYHNADSVDIQSTEAGVSVRRAGGKIAIKQGSGAQVTNTAQVANNFSGSIQGVFGSTFNGNAVCQGNTFNQVNGSNSVVHPGRLAQRENDGTDAGEIKIFLPLGLKTILEVDMKGGGVLFSGVRAGSVIVSLRDSAEAKVIVNFSLDASVSGNAVLRAVGTFRAINVAASGSSSVITKGTCSGDYSVAASGSSEVCHDGEVNGQVLKTVSRSARVSVG